LPASALQELPCAAQQAAACEFSLTFISAVHITLIASCITAWRLMHHRLLRCRSCLALANKQRLENYEHSHFPALHIMLIASCIVCSFMLWLD
jgi:hypothetical protein